MKKFLYINIFILVFGLFLSIGQIARADDTTVLQGTGTSSMKSCGECKNPTTAECKQYCGAYQINDFIVIAVKVVNIILGVVGSLALLMFIYGGGYMLLSAGNKERVQKGRSIIINAVIGLVIVFTSYLIIQFVMSSLGAFNEEGDKLNINNNKWFEAPTNE
jgi:hypothetical protein